MIPRSMLLVHDDSVASDQALLLACTIAGLRHCRLVVLAITEVHPAIPLVNLPAFFDEHSWNALVQAEEVAREFDIEIDTRLRRTHDAGKSILGEAQRIHADTIFLAIRQNRFGRLPLLFGRTIRAVMRDAPCPVLVGYFPPATTPDSSDVIADVQRLLHLDS
ncbi:MAG: universal stress protein [Chloroflexota bacterium]|nr:universal stress protein [Chloroflexota bacterium]